MEISNLTGLPELPEGQFWRVGETESSNSLGFGVFGGPIGAYVEIRVKVHKVEDIKHSWTIFGRELVYRTEEQVVETDTSVLREYIKREQSYQQNVYDANDELIGVRDATRTAFISGDDLTAEDILRTAEIVVKRLAEINKSRGFLGDYPPKNLNNPEGSA